MVRAFWDQFISIFLHYGIFYSFFFPYVFTGVVFNFVMAADLNGAKSIYVFKLEDFIVQIMLLLSQTKEEEEHDLSH